LVLIHPKPCRFDLTRLRVPSCSTIHEKVTSDRANDCFSLEVLSPMEGVSLSIGTGDSSSPPRVSDEVVRSRGSTDECNMTRLCNGLCHPRTEEKGACETAKILFSTISIFSDLHNQCILHRVFVFPLLS
jgi:hypothetical protein